MAERAIGRVEPLTHRDRIRVGPIWVLAGLLELLDRIGLDLIRPGLHVERSVRERGPERDCVGQGGALQIPSAANVQSQNERFTYLEPSMWTGSRGKRGRATPCERLPCRGCPNLGDLRAGGTLSAGMTRQSAPDGLAVGPLSSV